MYIKIHVGASYVTGSADEIKILLNSIQGKNFSLSLAAVTEIEELFAGVFSCNQRTIWKDENAE